MRSQRWLLFAFATLCALAVAISFLARPVDELANAMRLDPKVDAHLPPNAHYGTKGCTPLSFAASYSDVLALIPGKVSEHPWGTDVELPSGRQAVLVATIPDSPNGHYGDSSILFLVDDDRPWYQRASTAIERRLGM